MIALQRVSAHFRGRCQRQRVCKRDTLRLVYARQLTSNLGHKPSNLGHKRRRKRADCRRWDSNPQGLGSHPVPNRTRLPGFATAAVSGNSRGLVAAGLVCRWVPPSIHHSTTESGAGVAPAISTLAKDAAYYSPTRTHSPSGHECNTARGRFFILTHAHRLKYNQASPVGGGEFYVEKVHQVHKVPSGAQAGPLTGRWPVGRRGDPRPQEEAPQTWLAEARQAAQRLTERALTKRALASADRAAARALRTSQGVQALSISLNGPLHKSAPTRRPLIVTRAATVTDPRARWAVSNLGLGTACVKGNAASTYFRRSIRFLR